MSATSPSRRPLFPLLSASYIPARTSASSRWQCFDPDLNCKFPVFLAGPSTATPNGSVPIRPSTASSRWQCSHLDLNREFPTAVVPTEPRPRVPDGHRTPTASSRWQFLQTGPNFYKGSTSTCTFPSVPNKLAPQPKVWNSKAQISKGFFHEPHFEYRESLFGDGWFRGMLNVSAFWMLPSVFLSRFPIGVWNSEAQTQNVFFHERHFWYRESRFWDGWLRGVLNVSASWMFPSVFLSRFPIRVWNSEAQTQNVFSMNHTSGIESHGFGTVGFVACWMSAHLECFPPFFCRVSPLEFEIQRRKLKMFFSMNDTFGIESHGFGTVGFVACWMSAYFAEVFNCFPPCFVAFFHRSRSRQLFFWQRSAVKLQISVFDVSIFGFASRFWRKIHSGSCIFTVFCWQFLLIALRDAVRMRLCQGVNDIRGWLQRILTLKV